MPRLHSGAAIDRPKVTHLTLPPIPEVVWQQPQQTHKTKYHNVLTNETHENTHITQFKLIIDVEAQMSPIKETSSQVAASDTESFLESQTTNTSVQCPSDSNKHQHEIQRNETDMTTHDSGDDNVLPPKIKTSQIED